MPTQHLKALDQADAGDWDAAHRTIQPLNDPTACWIHANLHREEGDIGNADYWYNRAGQDRPATTIETERAAIRATIAV